MMLRKKPIQELKAIATREGLTVVGDKRLRETWLKPTEEHRRFLLIPKN